MINREVRRWLDESDRGLEMVRQKMWLDGIRKGRYDKTEEYG
jgi:hypothetical protein